MSVGPKKKHFLLGSVFFLCLCPQDTTSFDRKRSTSFFANQKHHSALADTKRGCLTANSVVLRTNDVGLRPTILHFVQMYAIIQKGGDDMIMILFIIFATLFIARTISGYDNKYNDRKYFVLQNKVIAKILLPKTAGWQRGVKKRSSSDFNKMTYSGAVFYLFNVFVILSIPVFRFLVPEIQVSPFEFEVRYLHIFVDTLNTKLPVLFSLILLAVEIIFVFINEILLALKQKKKFLIILSIVLLVIIFLFGLLQVEELFSTIIEVI